MFYGIYYHKTENDLESENIYIIKNNPFDIHIFNYAVIILSVIRIMYENSYAKFINITKYFYYENEMNI